MHPAHLSCAFNGYDALPPAYLFAARDGDVWRVIPVQEARDAWRTGRRVAFWPLPSKLE